MSVRPSNIVDREQEVFLAAQAVARGLHDRLGPVLDSTHLDTEFHRLGVLIEALPLTVDRGRIGFLRNWTASARSLWEQSETGTSRYQLGQMGRLLERLSQGAA
jgi:hypothetical protein